MRAHVLASLFLALALAAAPSTVRAQLAGDTSLTAPPVAPPLKKGSPLDHLTNDPKLDQLPVGYREGETGGAPFFVAHRGIDTDGGMGLGLAAQGRR